jgi:hypothetical protein
VTHGQIKNMKRQKMTAESLGVLLFFLFLSFIKNLVASLPRVPLVGIKNIK